MKAVPLLLVLCFFLSQVKSCAVQADETIVFISPATPNLFLEALFRTPGAEFLTIQPVQGEQDFQGLHFQARVVLDLLHDEFLSFALRQVLEESIELVNGNPYVFSGEVQLFQSQDTEIQAVAALASKLNLCHLCVFLTPEHAYQSSIFLETMPQVETQFLVIPSDIHFETLVKLVRTEVINLGFTSLVSLLPPNTTLSLLQAMNQHRVNKSPITLLLSQQASWYRSLPLIPDIGTSGPVYIADSGCEWTVNASDFVTCKLQQIFTHCQIDTFSVLQVKLGVGDVIGTIANGEVSIWKNCSFISEDLNKSRNRAPIVISFNNGTWDPTGETDTGEAENYLGASLAVQDLNSIFRTTLHRPIEIFNVSLGLTSFNQTWVSQQMSGIQVEDLGLAFVHGQYSTETQPLYDFLVSTLNYTSPQVGLSASGNVLTFTQQFPFLTYVSMSDKYNAILSVKIMKRYGWKHISILYSDDDWGTNLYALFEQITATEGIQIMNDETLRRLPAVMTEYPTSLIPFQNIANCRTRILLLILYGTTLYYTIDALYDVGLRRNDLLFFSVSWLVPYLFQTEDKDSLMKRTELLPGAIQFTASAFAGVFGKQVESRFEAAYHLSPSHFACQFYDSVLLIAHAVADIKTTGGKYEDPDVLLKAIRAVKFTGCSGVLSIEKDTNQRSFMPYDILNAQLQMDGTVAIEHVGTYEPCGMVLFTFTSPIIWPDNTKNVPTDVRVSSIGCPFDAREVVDYFPGKLLWYFIVLFFTLLTIIFALVIWRKLWNVQATVMKTKAEISFEDYSLFATIGIETLQYMSLGLVFPSWADFIGSTSDTLAVQVDSLPDLKQGVFWIVLDVAVGLVCLWCVFLLVIWLHLGEKWKCCCSQVQDLGEKLLPLLGNLCFIPITSILLNVYQCEQAVETDGSEDISDTFLALDCYQMCWTIPHLLYVIASGVSLFLYIPLAVLFRPMWQDFQHSLHVQTSPAYLMAKSIYQILIISSSKTLRQVNGLTHSITFFFTTLLFTIFTLKWKPYGYTRANLWHTIGLICVLWLTSLITITSAASETLSVLWLSISLSGVGIVCVSGCLWQYKRLPALLYRRQGTSIMTLIRFQFSTHNEAYSPNNPQCGQEMVINNTVNHQVFTTVAEAGS